MTSSVDEEQFCSRNIEDVEVCHQCCVLFARSMPVVTIGKVGDIGRSSHMPRPFFWDHTVHLG